VLVHEGSHVVDLIVDDQVEVLLGGAGRNLLEGEFLVGHCVDERGFCTARTRISELRTRSRISRTVAGQRHSTFQHQMICRIIYRRREGHLWAGETTCGEQLTLNGIDDRN
jgi:hypothetical protein